MPLPPNDPRYAPMMQRFGATKPEKVAARIPAAKVAPSRAPVPPNASTQERLAAAKQVGVTPQAVTKAYAQGGSKMPSMPTNAHRGTVKRAGDTPPGEAAISIKGKVRSALSDAVPPGVGRAFIAAAKGTANVLNALGLHDKAKAMLQKMHTPQKTRNTSVMRKT